jgi:RNA polymerase sigma-70 factor (ECF subfamily)
MPRDAATEPEKAVVETRRANERADRVRSIVSEHYAFLWRLLRRLGVPEADVEDAAQKALVVVAKRIDDITEGKEKTFLFGVALRVAKASVREAGPGRLATEDCVDDLPAAGPDAEEQIDDRRARALLDSLLAWLPLDLRTVFVLYELEEMTMAEIAAALEIPPGTVASRLRRAREEFQVLSERLQRQMHSPGRRA